MFIDSGTLLDLEVFATTASSGLTLFSMVDRTRSRVGREHLRRRVATPAADPHEILDLQRAHRFPAEQMRGLRQALDRADLDAVERYLDSRWEVPRTRLWPIRALAGIWLRIMYPEYLREVENGQLRVVAMLRAVGEIRRTPVPVESATVRTHLDAITEVADSIECRSLLRIGNRQSAAARLAFDMLARGAGIARLRSLTDHLGALEAIWSVGAASAEHGWVYPIPGSQVRITGLYHPFLGRDAVANNFSLDPQVRVCFMTGPNMAGKSTFLKAYAVASLLAQIGAGVPAEAMEFVPVALLFSSVQIIDNIGAGESFYLAEVRRIRSLALALREHDSAIAVIDEPFRGTNVHDAFEASLAVITRLAQQPAGLTLVASHLGELGTHIVGDPRIRLLHFAADVSADPLRFDFLIREGVSGQRLGMILLNQERVLELLDRNPVQSGSTTTPS